MSFKCIICDGRKLKKSNNSEDNFVIALRCGHLFHKVCSSTWFTEKGIRQCPTCKTISVDELRVYLGDEDDPNESLNASRRELEDYAQRLEAQLEVERRRVPPPAVPAPVQNGIENGGSHFFRAYVQMIYTENERLQGEINQNRERFRELEPLAVINTRQAAEIEGLGAELAQIRGRIRELDSQAAEIEELKRKIEQKDAMIERYKTLRRTKPI